MAAEKFTFDEIARHYRERSRPVDDAVATIRRTVKLFGPRRVQETISALAPRAPVDRGTYRRSWHEDDIPNGAAIYNSSPYAAMVEWGRRPGGRMPPLSVIRDWVIRKKITTGDPREVERAARSIQRAIGRRGIQGRHVLQIAARRLEADVRQALARNLQQGGG